MRMINLEYRGLAIKFLTAVSLLLGINKAHAGIQGLEGPAFSLTAREGWISTADGGSVYAWGYANGNGPMQYPGVTMIVNQGDTVTVSLSNALPLPVSIVFPGQNAVKAIGGVPGMLTNEAPPGGSVSYSFVAEQPGTYLYHSGTRPEIEVEMGLVGALVVRPTGFSHASMKAYADPDSAFDHEYLFLLTEMDPRIHDTIERLGVAGLQNTNYLSNYFPVLWFINGRNAPDTMLPDNVPWLLSQPYSAMPMMHPGERLLMRVIGGGRDLHPFHHHGNHARVIARNGRVLSTSPGSGADLSYEVFTVQTAPGETVDAIFTWNGGGLNWDVYGHKPSDPLMPGESVEDHGKPFPIVLPEQQSLTYGAFYSGSPFLGSMGILPPGSGNQNTGGEYVYMWHSHTEKEMTNYDIFPGGMMTMLMVVPHGVSIAH